MEREGRREQRWGREKERGRRWGRGGTAKWSERGKGRIRDLGSNTAICSSQMV